MHEESPWVGERQNRILKLLKLQKLLQTMKKKFSISDSSCGGCLEKLSSDTNQLGY